MKFQILKTRRKEKKKSYILEDKKGVNAGDQNKLMNGI